MGNFSEKSKDMLTIGTTEQEAVKTSQALPCYYTEETGVEARIRSSPPGEPTRMTAELAGKHNHATVQFAGELTGACNHTAVQLAGELTGVMVELAGEVTRITVQLSDEWLLCRIRSFVHFRSFFQ
ncbi:hypothetical protein HID58_088479 [Brassica napus]|uniref:AT-hook motif nuclear-localized protein n=1 Tax=Brassica napus TaxID=3708 RepID=A0ABQ7XYV0_BRANA|nr:hypothetical protein HID58_088479 [Brassica napus]